MSPIPRKRKRSSQVMTSQLLRSLCQFSEPDFLQLKKEVATRMVDPKNRIGLEGLDMSEDPAATEAQREAWEEWLHGIGVRYWGPGTARKWNLETGQEQIRKFMVEMVKYTNTILKNKVHSKTKVDKTSLDTIPPGKRFRAVVGQPSTTTTTTTTTTTAAAATIVDLEAEPEKQGSLLPTKIPVSQKPQRDFVLESTLAGSTGSIRLIYSTDAPTLAHLVEQVQKKHDLGPRRKVLKICAKIKDRCLNVDLEERRDWVYIMRVIADSGATPELIVWAS